MEANAKYHEKDGTVRDAIVESAYWTDRKGSIENGCNIAAAETTHHVAYVIRVQMPIAKKGVRHEELKGGGLADDWRPIHGVFEAKDVREGKAFLELSDEVRAKFAPPKPEYPAPSGNKSYGEVIPGDVAAVELQRREASYDGPGVPKRKGPVGV
jgi:hypothetical protein